MNWEEAEKYPIYKTLDYPKPIVDYKKQKELALKMYSKVFK